MQNKLAPNRICLEMNHGLAFRYFFSEISGVVHSYSHSAVLNATEVLQNLVKNGKISNLTATRVNFLKCRKSSFAYISGSN